MNNRVIERTKGKQYPVSIGTAIALESFFGVSEDNPLRSGAAAPYHSYECIVANLRTIARNYLSSYKVQELSFLSKEDLYSGFVSELVLINNLVAEESQGKILLSYYNNTYYKLKSHLKKANIKQNHTVKQQISMDLENKLCELVHADSLNVKKLIAYEYTSEYIRQGKNRNVIITHYPMDIVLCKLNVALLESHTGKIKLAYEFPSKLKRAGEDVPFNKYTIQLLGDSSGYIMSMSSSIRKEVLDICKKSGISPVTPESRFLKILKEHASPELRSALSGM